MTDIPRVIRIFCDADVLIAGAASVTGASYILLRMSEFTILDCLTSQYVVEEAERNLLEKFPASLPGFRRILDAAVNIVPAAPRALVRTHAGQAHAKDLPVLAAALACRADFLATFNIRHFRPRNNPPIILQPGEVLARIRASLARVLD